MEECHRVLSTRLPIWLGSLRKLVQTNSFTRNPAGISATIDIIHDIFANFQFSPTVVPCEIPDYGSHLLLHKPASTEQFDGQNQNAQTLAIACVAHLDTVYPSHTENQHGHAWTDEGEQTVEGRTHHVIRGPGVVDIKGGIITILATLEALKQLHPDVFDRIGIHVWMNAAEEVLVPDFGKRCVEVVRTTQERVCAALVFEYGVTREAEDGKVDYQLVCSRGGMAVWKFVVHGRGAHSGNAHTAGINAIAAASALALLFESATDYSTTLTFNVGEMHGGTTHNTVPALCEMVVEMRCRQREPFVAAKSAVQHLCEAVNAHCDITTTHLGEEADRLLPHVKNTLFREGICIDMEERTIVEPWEPNEGSMRLFQRYEEAAEECGCTVSIQERGGLSDGNYLWKDFPVIDGCGPDGAFPHCAEHNPEEGKFSECVYIDTIVPKSLLNAAAIATTVRAAEQAQLKPA